MNNQRPLVFSQRCDAKISTDLSMFFYCPLLAKIMNSFSISLMDLCDCGISHCCYWYLALNILIGKDWMDYLIFLNYSAENSLKMHDSAYLQNFSTDVCLQRWEITIFLTEILTWKVLMIMSETSVKLCKCKSTFKIKIHVNSRTYNM